MADTVLHLVGHVGTDVDHRTVGTAGTDLSTFRLASTPRYFDRQAREFVDGTTTWMTVQCWRQLAVHVRDSIRRGDPVVVIGKLRTEEWETEGQRRSRLLLVATSVGHDLARGTSVFTKVTRKTDADNNGLAEASQAVQELEHQWDADTGAVTDDGYARAS